MSDFKIQPETPEVNLIPVDLVVSQQSEGIAIDGTPQTNTANTAANPVTPDSNIVPAGGGSIVKGFLKSPNYNAGNEGWKIDANGDVEFNDGNFRGDITGATGTFTGTVTVGQINIGGDDATSAHIDTDGNFWTGASVANKATAPARIANNGDAHFSSISLDTDVVLADLQAGSALAVQYLTAGSITSKAITLDVSEGTGDCKLQAGKTDFTNADTGLILGIDDSDSNKPKFYCGTATDYVNFDGASWIATNLVQGFSFTAGENIAANDALSIVDLDQSFLTGVDPNAMGTNNQEKIAQSFQTALTGTKIFGCMFSVRKEGSPTDNVFVTLEADDNGKPSGTPLATSQDVPASGLTTPVLVEFIFTTPYALTASTTYWLVLQRDGALNDTNHYVTVINTSGGYSSGSAMSLNTPNWTAYDSGNDDFNFATFISKEGNVFKAEADYEVLTDGFVGFARAAANAAATVEAQLTGVVYKASWGLTEGKQYFLTDTAGAIGSTAGTYSKKVGKALTTEKLFIDKVTD